MKIQPKNGQIRQDDSDCFHSSEFLDRYLHVAFRKELYCSKCNAKLEIKEPYTSIILSIFSLLILTIGIFLIIDFGLLIGIISTFLVSQIFLMFIALVSPFRSED